MMRRSSWPPKLHYRWKRKLLAVLLAASCFATFALFESLRSRIHTVSVTYPPLIRKPKVAFLFIARNRIPLDVAWDVFFRDDVSFWDEWWLGDRSLSSDRQVSHSPYLIVSDLWTDGSWDRGKLDSELGSGAGFSEQLLDQIQQISISGDDSDGMRWKLTSSGVFSTTSAWEQIRLRDRPNLLFRAIWSDLFTPTISVFLWCILLRRIPVDTVLHARGISSPPGVCVRKSLPEFWRQHPLPADGSKEHNCIPDEHYVQTLLFQRGLQNEITRRSLTHTSWDLSSSRNNERRGWHPVTYKLADATPQLIQSIKAVDNIFYKSENRREWCTSKGKPSGCFLFSRKFTRPAAIRLVKMSALVISTEATNGVTEDRLRGNV
ncbi:Core-2/I-branching beta-1-6-N-acetylglucosaminyltransferase family protein [Striga hermonthica]|uniref:Core-2/I-branching beta-1-6-N-acetylglucosaminyltransferase family protein n=1 Tax=Striga hermonthica TaxID=68872 RepID=A0A9N7N8R5_STRHE|nr:Core-2/I-branching beta-1-6-N-acetylglucosaminyltransferase family protein [Striga hermonthica]